MPKFSFIQKHQLSKNDAKIRLSKLVDELKVNFHSFMKNPQESWEDYTAHFSFEMSGGKIQGKVIVFDDEAQLEISYPLILTPFRGMVEKEIKRKAEELLS